MLIASTSLKITASPALTVTWLRSNRTSSRITPITSPSSVPTPVRLFSGSFHLVSLRKAMLIRPKISFFYQSGKCITNRCVQSLPSKYFNLCAEKGQCRFYYMWLAQAPEQIHTVQADPLSPEYLRLKEQREWKQSPHTVFRFLSSEKLKPALEQTGAKLECRSKLSLRVKKTTACLRSI